MQEQRGIFDLPMRHIRCGGCTARDEAVERRGQGCYRLVRRRSCVQDFRLSSDAMA